MEYVHADGEPDFDELCRIVGAIAAEYGIERVYLFGSRARGDNGPGSDYDFCIRTPDDMGLFKMSGFYRKLGDALGTSVDIVCEESLRDDFSRTISKDLRLIYEA